MKPTELRIGNYVNSEKYNTAKVDAIIFDAIFVDGFDEPEELTDISPIPLTEDWLLKFGFVEVGDRYYDWIKGEIGFANDIPDASYDLVSYDFHDCKIKYVHELQNLHFSLTGKEI
jgi:hypothetical protein